jgi:hypothetical protein
MCQGREDTVVSTQHSSYWLERAHDRAPAIRTPLYLSVLNSFCIVVCVVLKRGDGQPGSTFWRTCLQLLCEHNVSDRAVVKATDSLTGGRRIIFFYRAELCNMMFRI